MFIFFWLKHHVPQWFSILTWFIGNFKFWFASNWSKSLLFFRKYSKITDGILHQNQPIKRWNAIQHRWKNVENSPEFYVKQWNFARLLKFNWNSLPFQTKEFTLKCQHFEWFSQILMFVKSIDFIIQKKCKKYLQLVTIW